MDPAPPDFDSIKHLNPYGTEYWSARELAPLLDYRSWQMFARVVQRAETACEQAGQNPANHFMSAHKKVPLGSGAERQVADVLLSRFACYLVAQNGDPRKPVIALAQAYFATATRENELARLAYEQDQRLQLRERVSDNNRKLAAAAADAGVRSPQFGQFQNAGYEGLYGGLGVAALKDRKGIGAQEEILDRMGREELAANDFRITQTEAALRKERVQGAPQAAATHRTIGRTVRRAIEEIGGTMPEDLPAEPSIKPLLDERKRRRKKALPPTAPDGTTQGQLL